MSKNYKYVSFDCYGTLIDWEKGILTYFNTLFQKHGVTISDVEILKNYARFEADAEHGTYKPYREILAEVLQQFCTLVGINHSQIDPQGLAESVKVWPAFEDSHDALVHLQSKYKLVIISNIDDDLFAHSEAILGIKFDHVYTAMQMKSYKPNVYNFDYVQQALSLTDQNWLHVAQSIYHDHAPISTKGIDSVWIKRQSRAGDQGIAPVTDFIPKIVYPTMKDFAENM